MGDIQTLQKFMVRLEHLQTLMPEEDPGANGPWIL